MAPSDYAPAGSATVDTLFGLIMLGVIAGLLLAIVSLITRVVRNLRQPVLSRRARVSGIRPYLREHAGRDGQPDPRRALFCVTFAFEDGSSAEFLLTQRECQSLSENGLGALRTQGGWFRGFEQESPQPETDRGSGGPF